MSDHIAISPSGRLTDLDKRGSSGATASLPGRTASALVAVFVTSILLPFALLAIKGRRILLAIVVLDLPLQVCTHFFWDDDAAKLGAIGGLEISASLIGLTLLYVAWIVGYASRRELYPRPTLRTSSPLFLYLFFFTLSIFAASDIRLFSFEFCLVLQALLLYIYLINWIRTPRDVMFVITLVLIGMILESAIMIAVRIKGPTILPAIFKARLDDPSATGSVPRVGGTLGSPNTAGTYFAVLLAPVLSLLIMRLGQFWDLLASLAFCLGSVALVLTYTRGSWLASICSLGIVVLWGWRLLRPSHKALCLFGIIILASGILIQKAVSDRLLDKQAAESRIPLMQMALRMIADHPLLGVGANNYTVQMEQYATKNLSGDWMYAVHNKYLLIWAETGPGALLAFLWFIGATLRRGWNAWKVGSPRLSPLALGLTAGLIGLSISILSEPARGVMFLLLLVASLITAIDRWVTQAHRQHTNDSARAMANSNAL